MTSQRSNIRRAATGLAALGLLILPIMHTAQAAYERPGLNFLVSRGVGGGFAQTGQSDAPTVSANGRFVAFASEASDLVPDDTNLDIDVFLWDRLKDSIVMVRSSAGTPVLGGAWSPSISADGRYVAFTSTAPNLVPGDTNICPFLGTTAVGPCPDVFVWERRSGEISRVSLSPDGTQGNASSGGGRFTSGNPVISYTGRYIAYLSEATNLTPDDTGGERNAFLHDRTTGKTTLASVDSNGAPVGAIMSLSVSADGKRVLFNPPWEDAGQLLLREVDTNRTTRVDVATDGTPGNGALPGGGGSHLADFDRAMSADGRYIFFVSSHTNLVPNDTNNRGWAGGDFFIRDLKTGRTERVSVTSSGGEGTNPGQMYVGGSISHDGRYTTFVSWSHLDERMTGVDPVFNPAPWSCFSPCDGHLLFAHDLRTGATELLSVDESGEPTQCPTFPSGKSQIGRPSVSEGGRFTAYSSCNHGVVEAGNYPANNPSQIYLRDRGTDQGVGALAESVSLARNDSFSDEGWASTLDASGDVGFGFREVGGDLYGATLSYRPEFDDLFARIQLQYMPVVAGTRLADGPGVLYGLRFTANGTGYEALAQRIPGPDYDNRGGASFSLFREDPAGPNGFLRVGSLRGGYGTTGHEVVFSIPLDAIGLEEGGELSHVEAFSGLGSYYTGAAKVVDMVKIQ